MLASAAVEAKQALADLTEISSQIQAAVLMDRQGEVAASTLADEAGARKLGRAAFDLLSAAQGTRKSLGPEALTQLEAATLDGSVFVVRDGARVLVATTSAEPTVGLVFYDLKSCLRSLAGGSEEAKSKPATKKADDTAKKGDEAAKTTATGERAASRSPKPKGEDAKPTKSEGQDGRS